MRKNLNITPTTNPSLEYAAILSGLSMGGDFITDDQIKQARQIHSNAYENKVGFSLASLAGASKR